MKKKVTIKGTPASCWQTSLLRRSKLSSPRNLNAGAFIAGKMPAFLLLRYFWSDYFSPGSVKNLELKAVVRRVLVLVKFPPSETVTLFTESVVPVAR